jgi:hypothetical protein
LIWPLMKIQKSKSWNGMKLRQRSASQWHTQTFGTIFKKYSCSISRELVDSFVLRHRNDLTEIKSTPQEDPRLEVPRVFLDDVICRLRAYVQGIMAELVLNLDEVSMSKWEDRKDKKVIVLKTMDSQMIHHRASRNVKHISIITYITTEGESMLTYIMISHDSEPFHKRLIHHGVCLAVDSVLRQRSKSHVNNILFLEYINSIFIYYLNKLLETEEFKTCEAVLLMDNCSNDMSDDVITILTRERIRIVTFATQITHVFQIFDMMLSSTLKKHAINLETLYEGQNKQSSDHCDILNCSWEPKIESVNICNKIISSHGKGKV